MKLYLDNCCFNRPFDDQSQLRIRIETEAKLRIQEEIRSGTYQLTWSYILDYENNRNPFKERKIRIGKWKKYANLDVVENQEILRIATNLKKIGFHKMDSLHIACAIFSKCKYFLTTDDGVLKKSQIVHDIQINDPIGFIKEAML